MRPRPFAAVFALLLFAAALGACPGPSTEGTPPTTDATVEQSPTPTATLPPTTMVTVHLDGVPVEGATVAQGGNPERWTTDSLGQASIVLDGSVEGDIVVIAAHPDARSKGLEAPRSAEPVLLELERFSTADNPDYQFQPPGVPDTPDSTEFCSHCHGSINRNWYSSVHRGSASNPALQDLYAGTAGGITDAATCAQFGGQWLNGPEPGTDNNVERCFLGDGVIHALNSDCGPGLDCSTPPAAFGACADCHAPAINGQLGGRDLLEARGIEHTEGVHCDVCHKVESIDLAAEPGVAGRLHVVRPSEPNQSLQWQPLIFGPYDDVPNLFMGGVQRPHFRNGELCAGCHQQQQAVLVPGQTIDSSRWPTGTLPIHTTWNEWQGSQWNPIRPCQECHMPVNEDVGNSIDLGTKLNVNPGLAAGWFRETGEVRKHEWNGPRSADSSLFESALQLNLATDLVADELTVTATVLNTGAGHAVPTGDPMRSMLLLVDVRCNSVSQPAIGGIAVPDFGGARASQDSSGDWAVWPGAEAGQIVRVVLRPGGFHDYTGFGPFGDGTFDAAAKGMPVEHVVGWARIQSMAGDVATFETPLPTGDVAYLVDEPTWPVDEANGGAWAGATGFAFARVLSGADGRRMVPHFLATDVVSDNRILPAGGSQTQHVFSVSCATPEVRATLVHRAYPFGLAGERGWPLIDNVMIEVVQ